MSTETAALAAMAVLGAAGALPVVALIGPRWQAVPLAPLAGSVLAAVAGGCCLAVAGSIVAWFAVLSALSAVVAGWWLLRHRRSAATPVSPPDPVRRRSGRALHWVTGAGLAVVGVTVAWSLRPLRVPSTGWDARAIWLMRASWFADGHQAVLSAFRNPVLLIAHASYPPLVSATVAVGWQVTGVHGDRLGVVVTSLLNGCAVAAAAWALVEAGRVAGKRAADRAGRWGLVPPVAGVVAAGLFTLATFGVFGPFATNGYADPLWSAAAVGAIGYGLVLPGERANVASAGLLIAVCGLTKVEGTATAMVLVGLLVLRAVLGAWSARGRPSPGPNRAGDAPGHAAPPAGPLAVVREVALRPVVVGMAAVAALAVWPVLTRLEHATRDVNTVGSRQGDAVSRAHLTVDSMTPHLHVLLLAVPLALVSGALLARGRRASGLGNDLWAWAGLAAGLLAVGAAYVTGPGNTSLWLLTSVHRTTMFPAVAAWLIIAAWAIVAARTVAAPTGAGDAGEPSRQ